MFPCLTEVLGKSFITVVTALGSFHKNKLYGKFRLLIMKKHIPVYNALIVGNINTMHLVTARHTYPITFQSVTRFPAISIGTDKEPIKSDGKHRNNTKRQQIAQPYRHGAGRHLFLFPGGRSTARSRLTTGDRFAASHSIGFSWHMRVV